MLDWLSLHAAYNEAFRAPTLSDLFVSGVHFTCGPGCANLLIPNPDLLPETAKNKEISIRMQRKNLLTEGDGARFRATYFRNDVENFIERVVDFAFAPVPGNPGVGGIATSRNVRDAELKGYELELAYDAPRWHTGLSYTRTRSKNEGTGAPLSDTPADTVIAQLGIRFPAADLSLDWNGRFVNSQNLVPAGGTRTGGYVLHGLRLSWAPVHYRH